MSCIQYIWGSFLLVALISLNASERRFKEEEITRTPLTAYLSESLKIQSLADSEVSDTDIFKAFGTPKIVANISHLSTVYIRQVDPLRYECMFCNIKYATLWAEKDRAAIAVRSDRGVIEFPVTSTYFLIMPKINRQRLFGQLLAFHTFAKRRNDVLYDSKVIRVIREFLQEGC